MDPLTDVPFYLGLCLLKPQTKENLSFLRLFPGGYSFGLKDGKSNYQAFPSGFSWSPQSVTSSFAWVLDIKGSIAWTGKKGHFDGGPSRCRALKITVRATSEENGGGP